MKEQRARVEPPKRSTTDPLLGAFTDICDAALRGIDLKKSSDTLVVELKRLSGASSILILLEDRTKEYLHLYSSSEDNAAGSDSAIPSNHEAVSLLKKSERPVDLDAGSEFFSELRDSLFSGAVVNSVSMYPLRTGSEFIGLLVASYREANHTEEEAEHPDPSLSAAAKQLSLALKSAAIESEHTLLEKKYAVALSQVGSPVFVFELSTGKLIEANDAFFTSFGYDKSELARLTLFDLVFDSRETVEANIKCAAETGGVHFPSKSYRHKNGSAVEMQVTGTNIVHGERTYAIVTATDLTETRKAEVAAELQRVRYENFIRNSAEGIWRIEFTAPINITQERDRIAREIAERGVIAECNNALARMYGFEEAKQLIGKRALDFVADLDVYAASKLRFTEQNFSITNVETIEKDRRGNIHYFENSYIGETRNQGLIRMWGIQRDITEKRRLQEQLRLSEYRYRNLIEQANDMILLFDKRGEFVFANLRFFEQTGYTADEIWGKSVSMVAHPGDAEELKKRIAEQFESPDRHLRHTLRLLTKYDEERIVELSMTTLRTADQATGILAIGRDVTVEQSVKTALHESEEKYRSLVEHSLLAVLVVQEDTIVYANPTATTLFETEMSNLQGSPLSSFIHPIDYLQIFEKFTEAASTPNTDMQFSVRAVASAGKLKSIEGWAAGITYMGKPAIQVAMVDITDTKKLQEQLFQSQKMESIGQLASGVAHDFNNLLGSIYGAIGMLRKKFGPREAKLVKYVDILDASAKRAAELTSQLLTFSRQRESDVTPIQLNDVINDAMKILVRSIGKNIKVEYSLDPALYNVEADPSQIEGIIINLSINSRDAMPDGGILRITTSNVEFDKEVTRQIADARPGRYVCLAVTDSGVGMDEVTKQRIFEPFFTTKPIGKGTGLGLSIVYGTVKNHRGFINVYSEPGHGTTFKVYLPATNKMIVGGAEEETKDVPHGNETILIVDDEQTLLDLTKEILEGLGYKVIPAHGALEGIKTYKERHDEIDLVILDMLMPDMTGNEVYPVLKNIDSRVTVLLATGLSVGEKVDDMISLGVDDIVAKPYSVSDLATHTRKVIDSKK